MSDARRVEQVFEVTLFAAVARLDNGLDRPFPALDRADTASNLAIVVGVK